MGKINKILGSGTSKLLLLPVRMEHAGSGGLESSGFPILTPVAVALTLAL